MSKLNPTTLRFTPEEKDLIAKLAELMRAELEEINLESSAVIRFAIKEALEKRGVTVPDELLGKKVEGRPKDSALATI